MSTWSDNWNNIIRNVIFSDDELKTLMEIPDGVSIIEFIDRYFIRAGFTNRVLKNEAVRIVYGMVQTELLDYKNTRNMLSFDIYVNLNELHNVEDDRLVMRTNRIAERLNYLLTKNRYTEGYRFWVIGESDMGTSTIGYARYNISFGYLRNY